MSSATEKHALEGFPVTAIRFVRALERNRENIAISNGLTPSDLRALFWIAEHASMTPKAVAEHMEMTTGAITATSLEWCRRQRRASARKSWSPLSRRSVVSLTKSRSAQVAS
jgi:hypothetical protein